MFYMLSYFLHWKVCKLKNFAICFVVCFDIGGLTKKQGRKRPWRCFDCLHCTSEESACNNENAQLWVQKIHWDKGEIFLREKVLLMQLKLRRNLRIRALPLSKCGYKAFMRWLFSLTWWKENGDLKNKQGRFQIRIRHKLFTRCERARWGIRGELKEKCSLK